MLVFASHVANDKKNPGNLPRLNLPSKGEGMGRERQRAYARLAVGVLWTAQALRRVEGAGLASVFDYQYDGHGIPVWSFGILIR